MTLPLGMCTQIACVWEATARKPGNVHRYYDFNDLTYLDFILSAAAVAPVLANAEGQPVGETVLAALQATRQVVTTNTNLGIVLLLTPLAVAPARGEYRDDVEATLAELTVADARHVYQAIRLANPGGLGKVDNQDLADEPTLPLRQVMALAQERDLIARQYVNGFATVWDEALPALRLALENGAPVEGAILACQLHLLAVYPDSLIARKAGVAEAEGVRRHAAAILERGWRSGVGDWQALQSFDAWLRTAQGQRNPGTTADLVTATLFLALRLGLVLPTQPFALPLHCT